MALGFFVDSRFSKQIVIQHCAQYYAITIVNSKIRVVYF